jgi:hypothetical protein
MLIDKRHSSCVLDVQSWRGTNIDSDHFLLISKFRVRISAQHNSVNRQQQKINTEPLRSSEVADAFSSAFSSKLNESPIADTSSINEQWTQLKSKLNSAPVQTIDHVGKSHKNPWFDEECRLLIEKKNKARKI